MRLVIDKSEGPRLTPISMQRIAADISLYRSALRRTAQAGHQTNSHATQSEATDRDTAITFRCGD